MERLITADGTDEFYMRPGRYVLTFHGSPAAGTNVELRGANGVVLKTPAGADVEITGGVLPEPVEVACSGMMSLVTTSFAGSSNLRATFSRLPNS